MTSRGVKILSHGGVGGGASSSAVSKAEARDERRPPLMPPPAPLDGDVNGGDVSALLLVSVDDEALAALAPEPPTELKRLPPVVAVDVEVPFDDWRSSARDERTP